MKMTAFFCGFSLLVLELTVFVSGNGLRYDQMIVFAKQNGLFNDEIESFSQRYSDFAGNTHWWGVGIGIILLGTSILGKQRSTPAPELHGESQKPQSEQDKVKDTTPPPPAPPQPTDLGD